MLRCECDLSSSQSLVSRTGSKDSSSRFWKPPLILYTSNDDDDDNNRLSILWLASSSCCDDGTHRLDNDGDAADATAVLDWWWWWWWWWENDGDDNRCIICSAETTYSSSCYEDNTLSNTTIRIDTTPHPPLLLPAPLPLPLLRPCYDINNVLKHNTPYKKLVWCVFWKWIVPCMPGKKQGHHTRQQIVSYTSISTPTFDLRRVNITSPYTDDHLRVGVLPFFYRDYPPPDIAFTCCCSFHCVSCSSRIICSIAERNG